VAGPGCVDFLGAASGRRRHGKPVRWSDARASQFMGDPRVKIGPVEGDRSIAGRPRLLDTRRHISARARKDVLLLVAGQGFQNDLDRQIGQRLLDHAALLDPLQRHIKARIVAVEVEQFAAPCAEQFRRTQHGDQFEFHPGWRGDLLVLFTDQPVIQASANRPICSFLKLWGR